MSDGNNSLPLSAPPPESGSVSDPCEFCTHSYSRQHFQNRRGCLVPDCLCRSMRPGRREEVNVADGPVTIRWLRNELGRNGLAGMYLRDGILVRTPRIGENGYLPTALPDDDDGEAQVRPVDSHGSVGGGLAARIALHYKPIRMVEVKTLDGKGSKKVPEEIAFPVGAARQVTYTLDDCPNLRRLRAVTHTLMLRADGSVLDTPGYDRATATL